MQSKPMNSKQKLAAALREAKAPDGMIQAAEDGYYSDYDSPLDTPCIQLVHDLIANGMIALADRAKEGEFDGTKEESDAWWEREGKDIAKHAGVEHLFKTKGKQ